LSKDIFKTAKDKAPVFVRKFRELNPQQKEEKAAKTGISLLEDDYDDNEVIEHKVIRPTDQWADGKKVYQKVIKREPLKEEVDLDNIEAKPIKYYVNMNPDKVRKVKKSPEQVKKD
jgi:hypothetical protein